MLVTDRGTLAGFTDESGRFIPGWFISSELSAVLSGRPVGYDLSSLEGYFAEGVSGGEVVKLFSGFYLTKTHPGSGLERGDLILRVAGETASREHLSRQLLLAPGDAVVTMLRGGFEREAALRGTAAPSGSP
jgi:hypothetical protein